MDIMAVLVGDVQNAVFTVHGIGFQVNNRTTDAGKHPLLIHTLHPRPIVKGIPKRGSYRSINSRMRSQA
ncbi:MAG: hypothetical protein K0R28_2011 [Paenibacillus sp.]|nr:hypothetical protein [Paenibacillus sp.]